MKIIKYSCLYIIVMIAVLYIILTGPSIYNSITDYDDNIRTQICPNICNFEDNAFIDINILTDYCLKKYFEKNQTHIYDYFGISEAEGLIHICGSEYMERMVE